MSRLDVRRLIPDNTKTISVYRHSPTSRHDVMRSYPFQHPEGFLAIMSTVEGGRSY